LHCSHCSIRNKSVALRALRCVDICLHVVETRLKQAEYVACTDSRRCRSVCLSVCRKLAFSVLNPNSSLQFVNASTVAPPTYIGYIAFSRARVFFREVFITIRVITTVVFAITRPIPPLPADVMNVFTVGLA